MHTIRGQYGLPRLLVGLCRTLPCSNVVRARSVHLYFGDVAGQDVPLDHLPITDRRGLIDVPSLNRARAPDMPRGSARLGGFCHRMLLASAASDSLRVHQTRTDSATYPLPRGRCSMTDRVAADSRSGLVAVIELLPAAAQPT